MVSPPLPADEISRLAALRELDILDTASEPDFDAITQLAARICKVPVSIVGFIDSDRHWFKAAVGVGNATENSRNASFCGHTILKPAEMLVVPDALGDERFATNPLVAEAPCIRFYAGVPLLSTEGLALGALCILDVVPHELEDEQREMLTQLARQVQVLLEHRQTISRLRFFESAIAHTNDAVLIHKAPGHEGTNEVRAVYVNDAFRRITGYGLKDVQDLTATGCAEGVELQAMRAASLRATACRQSTLFEVTNRRKGGQPYAAEISVSPVTNDEGRTTHWVSIERDVTERKQAEAALVRAETVEAANQRLTAEITERQRVEKQLTFAALHDDLTGLPNRSYFLQHLNKRLEEARETGRWDSAVLLIDLDRFKQVNDSLGHLVGDRLLCLVAQRLRRSLRTNDMLARFGGDEFTILADAVTSGNVAELGDRLAQALETSFTLCGHEVFIRASAGIALIEADYADADDILRDADIAMYRAKASGRDRSQVFHASLRETALSVAALEKDLRLALERGEFSVVYQPIVELNTLTISGFEALLRWRHPVRGLLGPDEFISVVEDTGLIVPVGEHVIVEACRQLRIWQTLSPGGLPLTMSVNVSAKQLSGHGFAAHLERTLSETGVAAKDINVELTESAVMQDLEGSLRTLSRLRDVGVKLHIDDFGTGYSSLSYLRQLQVDCVKIDRSFVSRNGNAQLVDPEIIDTIISLARKLGIDIVAEGVETEQQRHQLQALGCRHAQGYLFSRPLDVAAAGRYLTTSPVHEHPGCDGTSRMLHAPTRVAGYGKAVAL